MVNVDAIPLELRQRKQWVVWRYEPKAGQSKPAKVPYCACNPKRRAKVNDSTTWSSFDAAVKLYQTYGRNGIGHPLDGIGFVFSSNDPFVGIDFDHCRNPDTTDIDPIVLQRITTLNSYSEVSPSHTGVKVIARGSANTYKTKDIEVYSQGRLFTITGAALDSAPLTINDAQIALDGICVELDTSRASKSNSGAKSGTRKACVDGIPSEWWEDAQRHTLTVEKDEISANGLPRGVEEGTQSAYAARCDAKGMVIKWPFLKSTAYRSDGSIDNSMMRAVLAEGLYRRSYNFPRFAAILDYYFGNYVRQNKGKAAWRDDLAALWTNNAITFGPQRRTQPREKVADKSLHVFDTAQKVADNSTHDEEPPRKRGRPDGERATKLDVLRRILANEAAQTGIAAVHIGDLASQLGQAKRTIHDYLSALVDAGEITYVPGRGRGRTSLITLRDERIKVADKSDVKVAGKSDVCSAAQSSVDVANTASIPLEQAIDKPQIKVADKSHDENAAQSIRTPNHESESYAIEGTDNNNTNCVSSIAEEPATFLSDVPTLRELAHEYMSIHAANLENAPRRITATGEVIHIHRAGHFARIVADSDYGYSYDEAIAAYKAVRAEIKAAERIALQEFYKLLCAMTDDELLDYRKHKLRLEILHAGKHSTDGDKRRYNVRLSMVKKFIKRRGLDKSSKNKSANAAVAIPAPPQAPEDTKVLSDYTLPLFDAPQPRTESRVNTFTSKTPEAAHHAAPIKATHTEINAAMNWLENTAPSLRQRQLDKWRDSDLEWWTPRMPDDLSPAAVLLAVRYMRHAQQEYAPLLAQRDRIQVAM